MASFKTYYKQLTDDQHPLSIPSAEEATEIKLLGNFTRATGITIDGCGCCGSPFTKNLDSVGWDVAENQYSYDCLKDNGMRVTIYEDGTRWVP